MIKHLSGRVLSKLLSLFNKVWKELWVPVRWKEAIIIPMRKPGKDPSKLVNYRPIALTSHICKLMEWIINERHCLEKRGLVAAYQSGFRRGRSTMDLIMCSEDEVRKAQVNNETVAAVIFDVEKAYDMSWREELLIKLHQMGIKGNTFCWTMDFLSGRTTEVKTVSGFSDSHVVKKKMVCLRRVLYILHYSQL